MIVTRQHEMLSQTLQQSLQNTEEFTESAKLVDEW
jgi:hypothetical protein